LQQAIKLDRAELKTATTQWTLQYESVREAYTKQLEENRNIRLQFKEELDDASKGSQHIISQLNTQMTDNIEKHKKREEALIADHTSALTAVNEQLATTTDQLATTSAQLSAMQTQLASEQAEREKMAEEVRSSNENSC
jgi:uncharacterized phage infection (PIP) family protein YhgE